MASDPVLGPALALLNLTASLAWLCVALAALCSMLICLIVPLLILLLAVKFRLCTKRLGGQSVGVFHPYCDAGGGGERVLWVSLQAMAARFPAANFAVYTGDLESAPDQILSRASDRFNLPDLAKSLEGRLEFIYLRRRKWVEAATYPFFTLLGQSIGSVFLGAEALSHGAPAIYVDTMGYAFTLPLFKYFGGCATASYVHYPTISTDMLSAVRVRRAAHNNRAFIANSAVATWGKTIYYRIFAWLYGCCGRRSDVTMVNSSWTEQHISDLWFAGNNCDDLVHRVYPPCDTADLEAIERKEDTEAEFRILSLGQFRPEKDHARQIRSLARLRDLILEAEGDEERGEARWAKVKLVLAGGARNESDRGRVADLKNLCRHLAVEEHVEFKVNVPFAELKEEMARCVAGVHTMWNEHFGIAVVEMLAVGLMTVAHRSGGPLMDIVTETPEQSRNGFLAITEEEYAEALLQIMEMTPEARRSLAERARDSVRRRFSQREFELAWVRSTENLFSGRQ